MRGPGTSRLRRSCCGGGGWRDDAPDHLVRRLARDGELVHDARGAQARGQLLPPPGERIAVLRESRLVQRAADALVFGVDDERPELPGLELLARHDVDGGDLAPGGDQLTRLIEQRVRVAKEVRDERDPPARAQHGKHGRERPRPRRSHAAEHAEHVGRRAGAGARRQDLHAGTARDHESDGIAIVLRYRGQTDGDRYGQPPFVHGRLREGHGRARVHDDAGAHLRVVMGLTHVHAARAPEELPVDLRRLVARPVLAVLHELGRRADPPGPVAAVVGTARDAACGPVEPAHRIEERAVGEELHDQTRIPLCGTGTWARMSAIRSSADTPSASAAKFTSTRWRSTGRATRWMSFGVTATRPSSSARAFAPSTSAWPARGPAPHRTYFLTRSGRFGSPGRVARTSSAT